MVCCAAAVVGTQTNTLPSDGLSLHVPLARCLYVAAPDAPSTLLGTKFVYCAHVYGFVFVRERVAGSMSTAPCQFAWVAVWGGRGMYMRGGGRCVRSCERADCCSGILCAWTRLFLPVGSCSCSCWCYFYVFVGRKRHHVRVARFLWRTARDS